MSRLFLLVAIFGIFWSLDFIDQSDFIDRQSILIEE